MTKKYQDRQIETFLKTSSLMGTWIQPASSQSATTRHECFDADKRVGTGNTFRNIIKNAKLQSDVLVGKAT